MNTGTCPQMMHQHEVGQLNQAHEHGHFHWSDLTRLGIRKYWLSTFWSHLSNCLSIRLNFFPPFLKKRGIAGDHCDPSPKLLTSYLKIIMPHTYLESSFVRYANWSLSLLVQRTSCSLRSSLKNVKQIKPC